MDEETHLCTEQNICRDDGNLNNSHDQNRTDSAQESEDVIVPAFILPQAPEHEHQFNEQDRERNETSE